jgi:hypothetical protein
VLVNNAGTSQRGPFVEISHPPNHKALARQNVSARARPVPTRYQTD